MRIYLRGQVLRMNTQKKGDYQQRKLSLSKSVSYADSLLSFPRWKKKYPTIAMQNALRKTELQRAIVGYFFIYSFHSSDVTAKT